MAGLSSGLLKRCRTILLKCGEFDDHTSFQAIFVSAELTVYRDRLPQTNDRHERVNQTVFFLSDKYLRDGRPVFPIFLEELRDRYDPRDAQHSELEGLRCEVERELSSIVYIDIPFVIVAMTQDEATALMAETVFDSPAVAPVERTQFQAFRETLQKHGIVDLLPYYGERPEDWKPRAYPYEQQDTVEEFIYDMISHVNQERAKSPGLSLINPMFYCEDFFAESTDTRTQTWEQLQQSGCVLIVDAVSLFHPVLHQMLLQSAMSSSTRAAVLVFSPISFYEIPANRLIEERIGSQVQLAFARFDRHLDMLCEIGAGDLRAFRRWLFAILPKVEGFVQKESPNSTSLEIFRARTEEPPRVDQLVFSRRGGK
jgi:hypothetical protein